MTQYYCFTCKDWKGPWAADDCAAHDHFVVSEQKKTEIDKSQEGKRTE